MLLLCIMIERLLRYEMKFMPMFHFCSSILFRLATLYWKCETNTKAIQEKRLKTVKGHG
jgi:hypothetical protein